MKEKKRTKRGLCLEEIHIRTYNQRLTIKLRTPWQLEKKTSLHNAKRHSLRRWGFAQEGLWGTPRRPRKKEWPRFRMWCHWHRTVLKYYGLYLCFAGICTGSSSFFKTNLAFHLFVQCHCTGKHTFVGIAQDKLSKTIALFFYSCVIIGSPS